jgi:PLP dependent protein
MHFGHLIHARDCLPQSMNCSAAARSRLNRAICYSALRQHYQKMMSAMAPMVNDLLKRFQHVRRLIDACALRSGRSAKEVMLVAVTKTHPVETLQLALSAGLGDFGENRVQEAEKKIEEVGRERARWHLIGHLQANKVRRAVKLFDVIHSVDSSEIAERLDRHCVEEGRAVLPVLIQVDLGGEETKSGARENDLEALAATIAMTERLQLKGLMTVPPFFADPQAVRPFFKKLRGLRDTLQSQGCFGELPGELSMGMSHDFEIAIAEGATIVRIGTAIFGERRATH